MDDRVGVKVDPAKITVEPLADEDDEEKSDEENENEENA